MKYLPRTKLADQWAGLTDKHWMAILGPQEAPKSSKGEAACSSNSRRHANPADVAG
jgi:hypothetical protein